MSAQARVPLGQRVRRADGVLYNEYANGIRHREQLDRVLEESEELWIVPADVHF